MAGIAIVDGDRVLGAARGGTSGRGADLLVKIDLVCRTAGTATAALDAIAIGAGPGSFTGLRIGMATAKGIAPPTSSAAIRRALARLPLC